MTLNIMYADQAGIYQSSDYRLTWSDGRTADAAHKHLSIAGGLREPRWRASLTYTGLGRFDDVDVPRWFASHLTANGVEGRTLEEVAEIVRSECERRVAAYPFDGRLTLTLAGYAGSSARVFLISNFQSFDLRTGEVRSRDLSPEFRIESAPADGRLVITGAESAVSRADRRALVRVVRKLAGDDRNVIAIFESLAAVNERAARREKGISQQCTCFSMTAGGAASSVQFGQGAQPAYVPPMILGDTDLGELVGSVIERMQQRGEIGVNAQAKRFAEATEEQRRVRADASAARAREALRHARAATPAASRHEAYVPHVTGMLTVVDTSAPRAVETIRVGGRATAATVHPAGDRVYVTTHAEQGDAGTLVVLDTASRGLRTLPLGKAISGIALHPNGEMLYVADLFGDCVYVVDRAGSLVLDVIVLGGTPLGMAITPDGTSLYASCSQNAIVRIDTATNAVAEATATGVHSDTIDLSNDGRRLFATSTRTNTVFALDLETGARTDVAVMRQPRAAALTPAGDLWYVANIDSAHVSVIDAARFRELGRLPVGVHPNGVGVDPAGERVFVTNSESGTVSVIDPRVQRVVDTIEVGKHPIGRGRFVH